MTTKQVCKIIAHKARITNPQDYALYRLVEGEGKLKNNIALMKIKEEFFALVLI